MMGALRILGQALCYAGFVGLVGLLSSAPSYAPLAPNVAQIKLSFSHAGKRKVECRQRTPEEIAKLAPNMRTASACPRERWAAHVVLWVDDKPIYDRMAIPAGLSHDGPSSLYEKFSVAAGTHRIAVRIDDSGGSAPPYMAERTVTLEPAGILVVTFKGDGVYVGVDSSGPG